MTTPYKVRIQKDGFSFEAEGDKDFVADLLKQYVGVGQTSPSVPQLSAASISTVKHVESATKSDSKSVPPGEFIRRVSSAKHTDLVLSFGYYLEKVTGATSFTPADINTCYYEAKLEPSNTSQMIIMNTKKGFIMTAKPDGDSERKRYTLTRTGEEFVETILDAKK